jgi:hypothetical protein
MSENAFTTPEAHKGCPFIHGFKKNILLFEEDHSVQTAYIKVSTITNLYLAKWCINYISDWEGKKSQPGTKAPLLDYATQYWTVHAQICERSNAAQMSILHSFRWPRVWSSRWIHVSEKPSSGGIQLATKKWAPLHAAARYGLRNLVISMTDPHGDFCMNPDIKDGTGRTPLSLAAEGGHMEIVRILLQRDANVDERDSQFGFTPLHHAVVHGRVDVVEFLLDHGAALSGARIPPLTLAAAKGEQTVVRLLLEKGADPNSMDRRSGQTALHLAASRGYAIVCSCLLSHGADPNLQDIFSRWTPLQHAVAKGRQGVVSVFLNRKTKFQKQLEPFVYNVSTWISRVINGYLHTQAHGIRVVPHNSCGNTQSPASSPFSTSSMSQQSNKESKKRGRGDDRSSGDRDGSGRDPNKNPAFSIPSPSDQERSPMLGCPYLKHSPTIYSEQKSCRNGWKNVHRLKYVSCRTRNRGYILRQY